MIFRVPFRAMPIMPTEEKRHEVPFHENRSAGIRVRLCAWGESCVVRDKRHLRLCNRAGGTRDRGGYRKGARNDTFPDQQCPGVRFHGL